MYHNFVGRDIVMYYSNHLCQQLDWISSPRVSTQTNSLSLSLCRRLSSKKRRNPAGLWGDGGGPGEGNNSSEHSASSSPTGSMDCLHRHRPPNSTSPPTTSSSSRHSPPSLNRYFPPSFRSISLLFPSSLSLLSPSPSWSVPTTY